MLIGPRLRQLRQQGGLSLREVAEQAGFSPSFLSMVENDKVSPSVASMERLAAAFGLSLAEFFLMGQARSPRLVRAGERQSYTSEWSHARVELLAQQALGGELCPLVLRLAPGALSGKTPRPNLTEEFVIVLSGCAVLRLENEEEVLNVGDSISITAGTARLWENQGGTEAVLLIVSKRLLPPAFLEGKSVTDQQFAER
jgi:transcriptional regulator with XRE-family HTH domain